MARSQTGFSRKYWHCPYKKRCGCQITFSVKEYSDRYELWRSGTHDRFSHTKSSGILSPKQRTAVIAAVKSAPMAGSSAVLLNLKNFSPGKHVGHDARSVEAVRRLVSKTREEVMADRIEEGVELDGSEGSMTQLSESLSLERFIARHNDPDDPYHMDEHEVVCCGFQFKNGVRFMNVTTPHMLNNLARSENCGWQKQAHFDGAFNLCEKEFGLVGIGVNSMGAHFNPVSLNIVNSESKAAITHCWEATVKGFYSLYQTVHICDREECGFCCQVKENIQGVHGQHFRKVLASEHAEDNYFHIDKPSSDNCHAFFSFCKKTFGEDIPVQQCSNHVGGMFRSNLFQIYSK